MSKRKENTVSSTKKALETDRNEIDFGINRKGI
jgi:hypothetical protein